jgi:acyl-CoA thioesterase I
MKRIVCLVLCALAVLVQPAFAQSGPSTPTILVYGDSLSAAYGLASKQGWPALLEERLRAEKFNYTVANASISGETSAGGASRIAATLARHRPAVVILALGSNDGLRGLPIAEMKKNLATIITAAQSQKARVLVVGNRMPPNYGAKYAESFAAAFSELAQSTHSAVVPFMLEPIVRARDAFQADNLHPTAAAQPAILDHVWTGLQPMLRR